MNKKKNILYICVFFILILGLPVSFLVAKKYVDTENYENRVLAEWPKEFNLSFTENFDNAFNDNLPYKNQLVKAKSIIDIRVFKILDNKNVILGKDGWLFYKRENSCESYQGKPVLSDEKLASMVQNMVTLQQTWESMGKKFVLVICPNKEEVYAEKMPDYLKVIDEDGGMGQVTYNALKEAGVNVIYPLKELRAYQDNWTYGRYDAHYNAVGSFIVSQEAFKALGDYPVLDIKEQKVNYLGEISGEQARQIGCTSFMNDDPSYEIEGYWDDTQMVQPGLMKNNNPEYKGKNILVVGDSFGGLLIMDMCVYFENGVYCHRNNVKEQTQWIMENYEPDVVVFEFVERYLTDM